MAFSGTPTIGRTGVSLMRLLIKQKLDTFFFITADYAFGASLEADARDAIAKAGGTTIGGVRAPLNTADFSSYLLSANRPARKSSCSPTPAPI